PALPANIVGQTAATARISGVVTDAQGAVVSGATVKLIDKTTGLEKADTTNSEGRYVFASVEPSLYEITGAAQGFRTTVVNEVRAEVAKVATVDLSLQVGVATEEVVVKAGGEVGLQTDDAAVGNVIDGDRIKRLPTLDRQVTSLLTLQPTVAPARPSSPTTPPGRRESTPCNSAAACVTSPPSITATTRSAR
ncbi:MAG: carboxypeptidase-like regulatory domain-containing protein, partial [Blastocatellia bacterium]